MGKYLAIIAIILIGGCQPSPKRSCNKFSSHFSNQITKEYNLQLCETGGGSIDDVRRLHFGFSSNHGASISEARACVLSIANQYVYEINDNEAARQYLQKTPVLIKDASISCRFHNDLFSKQHQVDYVVLRDGKVTYHEFQSEPQPQSNLIYSETIDEALEHLQNAP